MNRYLLLAGPIAVVLLCGGCEERPEHADPDVIRQFDALNTRRPAGSAMSTAAATPTATPGASPTATSPVRNKAADAAMAARLADEAGVILAKVPQKFEALRLFAYASWHLDRSDKRQSADALFQKARGCVLAAPNLEQRSFGTSFLISVCSGGGHDSDYPALLVESDRMFDELTRGSKSLEEAEVKGAPAYRAFFQALVPAGRYDEAMHRLDALKTPAIRFELADCIVRYLADRGRTADVRHCADIMRQAAGGDSAQGNPSRRRSLCSVYALADETNAAERIFQSLPPATDVGESPLEGPPRTAGSTPSSAPNPVPTTYTAKEFRPIVDLAAARRRNGDTAGCIRLIETELEHLIRRDPAVGIAAWVACDEFERASQIVRLESNPTMKPRLAALLCLATAERGEVDQARQFAAEFARFPYDRTPAGDPSSPANRFDIRFASFEPSNVIPLLLGDEKSLRERIETPDDSVRCARLLRSASLLWNLSHPKADSYVPYQEESVSTAVFESSYGGALPDPPREGAGNPDKKP